MVSDACVKINHGPLFVLLAILADSWLSDTWQCAALDVDAYANVENVSHPMLIMRSICTFQIGHDTNIVHSITQHRTQLFVTIITSLFLNAHITSCHS